ncbi:MAG: DNA-methyltransferase [Candidatus Thorarchaeota archaeon]
MNTTISNTYNPRKKYVLFFGDCIDIISKIKDNSVDLTITSPPYFMGKKYDKSKKIDDFLKFHFKLLPEIVRITKKGGSICWQVGYHLKKGVVTPLDYLVYSIMSKNDDIFLRNRIIWTYGHGLHSKKRFSGRHETILWFTKGTDYFFDLDSVRIPQKYPGKKHYKGEKRGEYSCNPLGKNPSDVWDIPNVKAYHIEKTDHPCQFPIALVQRAIRSLTPQKGIVFDPFIGSGSTGIAAIVEGRRFIGSEKNKEYYNIAKSRCVKTLKDKLRFRPLEKPIFIPSSNLSIINNPFNKDTINIP